AKGKTATTVPSGISTLHREMYVAALEELRRPGPVVGKKDVLVLLSTIINTVAPSSRRFSISKHVKAASLLPGLDPNSDVYLSVTSLLRDLLVSLHPQIDHDRHCPPQIEKLKHRIWKLLRSTPEKTAAYTTLQIINQIILWIELGMFVAPTSEQVYVSAWPMLFNIIFFDANIRVIPHHACTSADGGRIWLDDGDILWEESVRIRIDNQWKTEVVIFEFKSSTSTPETCNKQQKKYVRINAAILLKLESRGLDISDIKMFLDHLRRFTVDVADVLAMPASPIFGNESDEDNSTPSPAIPPPKKRPNPYVLFSPSKRDKKDSQDYFDFVDDDDEDMKVECQQSCRECRGMFDEFRLGHN
ncbi:hypothetical protein BGZ65_006439, partial [Modicella reniformis]